MWHVTHLCGVDILSKLQLSTSNGLGVMMFWRSGGKGSLSDSVKESTNQKAVWRTNPATPGMLISLG